MSAKSRSRPVLLPIRRDDYIIDMSKVEVAPNEEVVLVTTNAGRLFLLERAARYKRRFKVHELCRP